MTIKLNAAHPIENRTLADRRWASLPLFLMLTTGLLLAVQDNIGLVSASWVGLLASGAGLLAVSRGLPGGFWTLPQVCLLVLCVFHTGALIDLLRTDTSSFYAVAQVRNMTESGRAILLSALGISAFAFGALVSWRPATAPDITRSVDTVRDALADVGALCTIIGCAAWFVFARSAGLSFGSTYPEYLAKTPGTAVSLFYVILTLGLPLAMTRYRRWLPRFAFAAYILFAAVAFPLGLRGEVLFGGVVAASVVATQRRLPGWGAMAGLIVVMLIPIAVVSQTRQGSESNVSASADPLQALNEMGGTLYVVAETVSWHDAEAEPYELGSTYWAPARDTIRRFVLRDKNYDPTQDMDYMSTKVISRVGYFGGSIIAEAYDNFAAWGVALILGGFGAMVAFSNSQASGSTRRLYLAILTAVTFQQLVRNSFDSVPVTLILGLTIWLTARIVASARPERT